ncbi:MAG: 2-phospho-L-lactate transferase CofD family protein, partial [Candidatus Paceibacterota bacterium]
MDDKGKVVEKSISYDPISVRVEDGEVIANYKNEEYRRRQVTIQLGVASEPVEVTIRVSRSLANSFEFTINDSPYYEFIEPTVEQPQHSFIKTPSGQDLLASTDGTGRLIDMDAKTIFCLNIAGKDIYIRPRVVVMQTNITETANYSKVVDFGLVKVIGDMQKFTRLTDQKTEEHFQYELRAGKRLPANPELLKQIGSGSTKLIVFGPGSFLTSVMPHFLVEGLAQAVAERKDIPRIFIFCPNLDNEIVDYSLTDMVEFIERVTGLRFDDIFSACITNEFDIVKLTKHLTGKTPASKEDLIPAEEAQDYLINNPDMIHQLNLAVSGQDLEWYHDLNYKTLIDTLYQVPAAEIRLDKGASSSEAKKSRGPIVYSEEELNALRQKYPNFTIHDGLSIGGVHYAKPRDPTKSLIPHIGYRVELLREAILGVIAAEEPLDNGGRDLGALVATLGSLLHVSVTPIDYEERLSEFRQQIQDRFLDGKDLVANQRPKGEGIKGAEELARQALEAMVIGLAGLNKPLSQITLEEFDRLFGMRLVVAAGGFGSRYSANTLHMKVLDPGVEETTTRLSIYVNTVTPGPRPVVVLNEWWLRDYLFKPEYRDEKMPEDPLHPGYYLVPDEWLRMEEKEKITTRNTIIVALTNDIGVGAVLSSGVWALEEMDILKDTKYIHMVVGESGPLAMDKHVNAGFIVWLKAVATGAKMTAGGKPSDVFDTSKFQGISPWREHSKQNPYPLADKGNFLRDADGNLKALTDWKGIPEKIFEVTIEGEVYLAGVADDLVVFAATPDEYTVDYNKEEKKLVVTPGPEKITEVMDSDERAMLHNFLQNSATRTLPINTLTMVADTHLLEEMTSQWYHDNRWYTYDSKTKIRELVVWSLMEAAYEKWLASGKEKGEPCPNQVVEVVRDIEHETAAAGLKDPERRMKFLSDWRKFLRSILEKSAKFASLDEHLDFTYGLDNNVRVDIHRIPERFGQGVTLSGRVHTDYYSPIGDRVVLANAYISHSSIDADSKVTSSRIEGSYIGKGLIINNSYITSSYIASGVADIEGLYLLKTVLPEGSSALDAETITLHQNELAENLMNENLNYVVSVLVYPFVSTTAAEADKTNLAAALVLLRNSQDPAKTSRAEIILQILGEHDATEIIRRVKAIAGSLNSYVTPLLPKTLALPVNADKLVPDETQFVSKALFSNIASILSWRNIRDILVNGKKFDEAMVNGSAVSKVKGQPILKDGDISIAVEVPEDLPDSELWHIFSRLVKAELRPDQIHLRGVVRLLNVYVHIGDGTYVEDVEAATTAIGQGWGLVRVRISDSVLQDNLLVVKYPGKPDNDTTYYRTPQEGYTNSLSAAFDSAITNSLVCVGAGQSSYRERGRVILVNVTINNAIIPEGWYIPESVNINGLFPEFFALKEKLSGYRKAGNRNNYIRRFIEGKDMLSNLPQEGRITSLAVALCLLLKEGALSAPDIIRLINNAIKEDTKATMLNRMQLVAPFIFRTDAGLLDTIEQITSAQISTLSRGLTPEDNAPIQAALDLAFTQGRISEPDSRMQLALKSTTDYLIAQGQDNLASLINQTAFRFLMPESGLNSRAPPYYLWHSSKDKFLLAATYKDLALIPYNLAELLLSLGAYEALARILTHEARHLTHGFASDAEHTQDVEEVLELLAPYYLEDLPKVFKSQDIRSGKEGADAQLTDSVVNRLGRAYGLYLKNSTSKAHPYVVVGADVRLSSPRIANTLIQALTSVGVNVIDITHPLLVDPTACTTSPLVYFAIELYKADGGVMITASHLEKEYNGLKFAEGIENLSPEALKQQVFDYAKFNHIPALTLAEQGSSKAYYPMPEYIEFIKNIIRKNTKNTLDPNRPLAGRSIVIDCGNGTSGFAVKMLQDLGAKVTGLLVEPDGTFPIHKPDPDESETLKLLSETVVQSGADLGIAYDCDGDRTGFVDQAGKKIDGGDLLLYLTDKVLENNPGATVVPSNKTTQTVVDVALDHEGKAVIAPTGYVYVKDAMALARNSGDNVVLGGEPSGHIMFADNHDFDDGMYTSAMLLAMFTSDYPVTIREHINTLREKHPYYTAKTCRIEIYNEETQVAAEKESEERVASFKQALPEFLIDKLSPEGIQADTEVISGTLNGVRLTFPGLGWILIRGSLTYAEISIDMEASSAKGVMAIINRARSLIEEYAALNNYQHLMYERLNKTISQTEADAAQEEEPLDNGGATETSSKNRQALNIIFNNDQAGLEQAIQASAGYYKLTPEEVLLGIFSVQDRRKLQEFLKAFRSRAPPRDIAMAFGGGTALLCTVKALRDLFDVISVQSSIDDGGSTFKLVYSLIAAGFGMIPAPGDQANGLFEGFVLADKLHMLMDAQGRVKDKDGRILLFNDIGKEIVSTDTLEGLLVHLLSGIYGNSEIVKSKEFAFFAVTILNIARLV